MTKVLKLSRGLSFLGVNLVPPFRWNRYDTYGNKPTKPTPILLALLVLGIVSFFLLSFIRDLQVRARDQRRKTDLLEIQKTLETYYASYGKYPGTIEKMPGDPVRQLKYFYRSSKDGSKYQLFAKLENKKDPQVVGGLDSDCGVACNYGLTSANVEVGGKLDE